jgi:peroxiredoxin Q/BCP
MKTLTKLIAAISGGLLAFGTAAADPLTDGAALPAVTVKNQGGADVDLAKAGATGYLLVYFYPRADTPGCTKQACSLRDSFATLTEKGVKVFGVSTDSVEKQKAFQDKYKLPFDLLADTDAKVADAFGVPHLAGFASRQAYLFKDGKLVWKDTSASTDKQAADVLEFLAK